MFKFSKLLSWILSGIMIVWIIYSLYWFVADSAITKEELIYEIAAIVIVMITLVTLIRIRGLKLNEPESFKGKMNLKNAVLTIANSIAGAAFFLFGLLAFINFMQFTINTHYNETLLRAMFLFASSIFIITGFLQTYFSLRIFFASNKYRNYAT